MQRLISLLAMCLLAALFGARGLLAADSQISVSYDTQTDLITLQATNAPLSAVMKEIAATTGIAVRVHPDIQKTVTARISSQPLEQALKRLSLGLSHALEYAAGKPSDAGSPRRVVGIWLLPEGLEASDHLPQSGPSGGERYSTTTDDNQSATRSPAESRPPRYFSPGTPEAATESSAAAPQNVPRTNAAADSKPAPASENRGALSGDKP